MLLQPCGPQCHEGQAFLPPDLACSQHLGILHHTNSPSSPSNCSAPGLPFWWGTQGPRCSGGDVWPWVQMGAHWSLTFASPGVPVGPVCAGGAGCQHERPCPWGAQAHHLLVSPGACCVTAGQGRRGQAQ